MTSSMAGRNGLPDGLGTDREPQVATRNATPTPPVPAVPVSSATATATATTIATTTETPKAISKSPASNGDNRDSKVADPAPTPVLSSTPAPIAAPATSSTETAADVPDSSAPTVNSNSAISTTPTSAPPSAAAAAPASASAPSAPAKASTGADSVAPVSKPSTPNPDLGSVSATKLRPSTPPAPSHSVHSVPLPGAAATTTSTMQQQAEAPLDIQASAPVNVGSGDHPMLDAPAANNETATSNTNEARQSTPLQLQMSTENMTENITEQFAPSTPYTPAAMPSLNQHAYIMMALASMSGAPAMSPPPTVTPAQVTLPNSIDETFHGLAPANSISQTDTDKELESFARIEFADSVFQLTTYAVIIGRDQRALDQARRDEKRTEDYRRRAEENAHLGLPPPSPIQPDRSKFSKSYVSEEGGMLGPESDTGENPRPTKRRKTSTQGSSQHDNDEAATQAQENMISNRQYVSHTPGAAAVDLTSLRPSPWHVPFIGIHSPGPNIASKTKAISREHLKIAYNREKGVFEAIPLHKNGFFCEDVHYKSEKVVLRCGDYLQIKDIGFRFLINGVERGRTGAEEEAEEEPAAALKKRHAHGGKEMSFDFESSHGNGPVQDTSDELSEVASPPELSDFGEEEDAEAEEAEAIETVETVPEADAAAYVEADLEAEADADADADAELDMDMDMDMDMDVDMETPVPESESAMKQEGMPDSHHDHLMAQIPKKRGPGRPPKNGIMSKREQRLLKKQQQEMAKKTLPQVPPVEPPIKRKVGRPRKHPLPEGSGERPEKRKYKPRKPREDGGEGSDAERRAREKKEKKARPKSPPLELKIEDYTEEQLHKPNKNYGVLIDETLTAAGPDGLTLKQIYKRICQRYPWFYFHTETKGWESSVRHNLIGNEAFRKDETTNLWARVPGVELDAGKKRKASSPDRAAAQAYSQYPYPYNAQHMAPGAPGYPPGQAPAGYQIPAYATQQGQPGRPVQPYGASASPPAPGQPAPTAVASQPPAPAQLPPGYGPPPAPARPALGVPQQGTYSSPYAPRPPPPANPPIKSEDGHATAAAATAAAPGSTPLPQQQQHQQHLPPPPPPTVAAKTVPGAAPAQQPATPSNRTPSVPATAAPARPVIEPRLLTAVVNLKNGLIENLKKARNPKAEGIVMSALNRCIGLKKEATENDKMEAICIKGIRQLLEGFIQSKSPTPGPASSASPSAAEAPLLLDSKVLVSLTGFKDVSTKALNPKLGEAKAEAVTLSAIDRVLGLADVSIVPPPGEGEAGGNFEGVEQHLMKSIRQLLIGLNQKVQGS